MAIEKEFNILRTNMETNYWTPRYKYLEYQLNMAPFDFWFESTEDAIVAWETVDNLWYRLGFSYIGTIRRTPGRNTTRIGSSTPLL